MAGGGGSGRQTVNRRPGGSSLAALWFLEYRRERVRHSNRTACTVCLRKQRRHNTTLQARRRALGLCVACGAESHGLRHCPACLGKQSARLKALREEILRAYGGQGQCCGEREPCCLHLDHLDNNGYRHRQEIGTSSSSTYRSIK